jgi:hypothetical protein
MNDFMSITEEGGESPYSELIPIIKAFESGQDYLLPNMTGSQAGRIQNLQQSFVDWVDFESEIRFIKSIPKTKVSSPVLEHARLKEVAAGGIFFPEGGDVDYEADTADKTYDIVKYLGVKMEVTGPAAMTQFIQPAEVSETDRKGRTFAKKLNEATMFGDASINSYEFDGVINQVLNRHPYPTQAVYDLRGKRLTDVKINDAVTAIRESPGDFGPLKLFLSYAGVNNYTADKIADKRYISNAAGDNKNGLNPTDQYLDKFTVSNGKGVVETDFFLSSKNVTRDQLVASDGLTFKKNNAKAPDAPTVTNASEASSTPYSLANGDYEYAIVPMNRYGYGMATEVASLTHSGGGKRTKFTITAAVTGESTLGYRIYVRDGSSSDIRDYKFLYQFKKTGSPMFAYDDGEWIKDTTWGILVSINADQTMDLPQYSDMMKVPYGQRADKREWLLKWYGTFRLKNPFKVFLFKNMGALSWS